jgi:hypothetical protein
MITNFPSKAKWIWGVVALIVGVMIAVLIGAWLPVWMLVLISSAALALLYIVARLRSRYDPLDPRFGSCIPPINMPKLTDSSSPARPDIGDHRFDG